MQSCQCRPHARHRIFEHALLFGAFEAAPLAPVHAGAARPLNILLRIGSRLIARPRYASLCKASAQMLTELSRHAPFFRRLLLANPRLLILDEPTSGLSPDLDRSMMELCRKLSHQNCTVLMVTHNMSNINLCDKIAFLGVGGVLCYYGAPEKLHRYFDVELTSDIFEKLRVPELIEQYRQQYFTTPEFNRLVAAWPEAAQEADKRCSQ